MEQAKQAYEAYVLALEGKAPAGLAAPPCDLQTWDKLPAPVRAAWEAATLSLLDGLTDPTPAPEPTDSEDGEPPPSAA